MKKTSDKRLRLMRSVVRDLTRAEAAVAVGGRLGQVGCVASCNGCTVTAARGADEPPCTKRY